MGTLGNLGTDYKFTGQREEASLGIYFFNARWMDPSLGRFTSPDTIVPTGTQGTQAWDRYAFVNNNPVRYNDPTGHKAEDDEGVERCEDPSAENYEAVGPCKYREQEDEPSCPSWSPFTDKYCVVDEFGNATDIDLEYIQKVLNNSSCDLE